MFAEKVAVRESARARTLLNRAADCSEPLHLLSKISVDAQEEGSGLLKALGAQGEGLGSLSLL